MNDSISYVPLQKPVAIKDQEWPKGTKPLVATRTLAYNHEKYIRECLDGILMQETTFPVRIVIFEDCSKDSTANIIKEYQSKYPKLIIAFCQKENTYQKEIRAAALKPYNDACSDAKYLAFCEGDDYWVDPRKLQKQVDYLDAHPEAFITYHSSTAVNHDATKILHKNTVWWKHQKNYTAEQLMKGEGFLPTLTWVYRNIDFPVIKNSALSINGDRMLLVSIGVAGGEGHYVPNIKNAVYRKHDGGVWSQIGKDAQVIEQINTRVILARHFLINGNVELANYHMKKGFYYLVMGQSILSLFGALVSAVKQKAEKNIKKIIKKLIGY